MRTEYPVKRILKGALFFAGIGPLLGGMQFLLFDLGSVLRGFQEPADLLAGIVFLAFFSYIFGAAPAFITGLICCSFMQRIHTRLLFIGVSVMTAIIVSYVFFEWGMGGSGILFISSVVPAVVTSWLWWNWQTKLALR